MKKVVSISLGSSRRDHRLETILLGERFEVQRIGTDGDQAKAFELIRQLDGTVDAIGLGGMDVFFHLGDRDYIHKEGWRLFEAAKKSPIVDGSGLKHTLERWAITYLHNARPEVIEDKRVLVMSGIDRFGMAQVIQEFTDQVVYGDFLFTLKWNVPLKTLAALKSYARLAMPLICRLPFDLIYPTGKRQEVRRPRHDRWFKWAEVIVGDFHQIQRYAPQDLTGKTLITNTVTSQDLADLKARGVSLVVTTTPEMDDRSFGTNVLEAMFVALLAEQGYDLAHDERGSRSFRDEYLNLILEGGIEPRIIELTPTVKKKPAFVFVIHPLRVSDAFQLKAFAWLRNLPPKLLEMLLANVPPLFISKARGVVDAQGNEVDGFFYALIMTPRMMMAADPEDVYRGLHKIAEMASDRGAKIMGLGAFTSVVGDAGVTVAKRSPIPVTSGNSLTIWACVESARQAMAQMGKPLSECNALVVGATGSIGRAVTKVLAEEVAELYIVSRRPEKVLEFTREIQGQRGGVEGGIKVGPFLPRADLIIATTTDPEGVIDVMKLKPGCVVVDVARPPDVSPEEAGKRDDILVIESGEIRCPGNPSWGVDIGLPKGIAFACLTETIILTLEERWESYTVGREIDVDKVNEIGALALKHGFVLSGISSFGKDVSEDEIQRIRRRAEKKLGAGQPVPAE